MPFFCAKPLVTRFLSDVADGAFDEIYQEVLWLFEEVEMRAPLSPTHIPITFTLPYIPSHLHGSLFKTFYMGFRGVFGAIAQVLRELAERNDVHAITLGAAYVHTLVMMKFSGALPWKYHIDLDYFEQRAVEFYFNKGGKIEYALDLITSLDQLIAELESGEETIEQAHGYLPACVNDREVRLVRKNMGLSPRGTWGPYIEEK